MIKSFKHKALRLFFINNQRRGLGRKDLARIRRILDRLDVVTSVVDMNLPGYGLHRLQGDRKNIWSVRVSGNWRITFDFRDGDVFDVNLEDYH